VNREPDDRERDDAELIELGGDSGFLAAIPDDASDDEPGARSAPERATAHDAPPDAEASASRSGSLAATATRRPPPPPSPTPVHRDRVVILGRRASGKTVFLARLYGHLYRGAEGLTIQARDGPSHLRCIAALDSLERGEWPAATGETAVFDLEIGFPGGVERLVALDYPGELFRRAFLDEVASPDVYTLLEHVDRAAAVLLLIDPALTRTGSAGERAEDDFGMIQALRRIRSSPGGARVPVALVLTKIDANSGIVRAAGGLKPFVERHYPALVRAARGVKVFACAAVRTMVDPLGRRLPQIRAEPAGIVAPLAWCLTAMGRLRRDELEAARAEAMARLTVRERELDRQAAVRERRILVAIWVIVAVVLLVGALVVAVVMNDRGATP